MKKNAIYFGILIILAALASCSQNLEVGELERYGITLEGSLPSETSKIPTCKGGIPERAVFAIRNANGELYSYESNLTMVGDRYRSSADFDLAYGSYTIENIDLLRENDTIYSIPTTRDTSVLHYADLILPVRFTLERDTHLSGTAMCYTPSEEPTHTGDINGDFRTLELGSLFFYVTNFGCVTEVTVTIDDYRWPEVRIHEAGTYEIAVPVNYRSMIVRAYTEEGYNSVQSFPASGAYTSDDPYDGSLLIFDYECE